MPHTTIRRNLPSAAPSSRKHSAHARTAGVAIVAGCVFLLTAAPAHAQYRPRPLNDPATGEQFHIEADASFWPASADITVASAGSGSLSGLNGTEIDAKRDLGVTDQRFPMLNLQLRPARSHHFRLQYIPIQFTGAATLPRDIVFNGIRYNLNTPVNSSLDWKAFRFGYQYDFIVRNRGFGGFIMEAKYTDVTVQLNSPFAEEFARARAPIPAIGGIGRVYVVPNISITGEVTGFKIPDSIDSRYNAHYVDVDVYGTVNFTDRIGVKGGYRSLDLGYLIKDDSGSFVLRGLYFGAVVRY
jgi:hypothetical protein